MVHPYLKTAAAHDVDARFDEAVSLAQAIDLSIVGAEGIALPRIVPATLIGPGKVEELALRVEAARLDLIIVDAALSPIQQRNLERATKAKVIDRTGLILEIFGARARTREGELQVELAHLAYQRSRLVRSWTHLERQRGGVGFLGGPGETQIEADRRMLAERMTRLKRQLEAVTRTRDLQRARRQKAPYPTVALVGYTNAGKSTLFNTLVGDEATMAADMLFATLDPTIRGVDLGARRIILSDTVGFISDLPTMLVAAFRATLEEVVAADLIVHVRDVSHPETEQQRDDVLGVLAELGVDDDTPIIEATNKIDRLSPDDQAAWQTRADRSDAHLVAISARTGQGLDRLLQVIDQRLGADDTVVTVHLPPGDGRALAWLHAHGDVLQSETEADGHQAVTVRLAAVDRARFAKQTGYLAP
ncbi:MAG: GTPase HflX [Rhodothalassiaceae bacterium]